MLRHSLSYCIPTLITSPLFVEKALYQPFYWCPENNFGVSHVYQGLSSKSMHAALESWLIQKNRIKIIIANSKIKQKSKQFWEWSEIYFLLSFCTLLRCTIYVYICIYIHVYIYSTASQSTIYIYVYIYIAVQFVYCA